jgi:hypothetical protein
VKLFPVCPHKDNYTTTHDDICIFHGFHTDTEVRIHTRKYLSTLMAVHLIV